MGVYVISRANNKKMGEANMAKKVNHSKKNGLEMSKGPSPDAFRKVKWIRRKRGLIGFFAFLSVIGFILFFDYYWDLISRTLKQPSREAETTAGKFLKVSDKERRDTFDKTRQLLNVGSVEEARQLILKYLQKESNAEGNYLAGLVYMRQGDINSAYRYFKEAIRLKPDYYDAQQKLAEVYITVGDLKSAQQTASALLKQDNYQEDGLLLQSEIDVAEGKLEEAMKKIQVAIDNAKGDVPEKILIQQASLYARKGGYVKADQIIAKIDENKLNASELLLLVRYYLSTSRNEKATSILNAARKRYPESPEVNSYYGQQLFNQGKYSEALPYFQKVYALMPESRIASYRVGQSLLGSGQMKEAKQYIDRLILRYPNDILVLSLKVKNELLNSQKNEAISTLKHTITLVPEAPRPYTLLAELYWGDGIMSVAEVYAQKALKLGERAISPRIILGDIYFRKRQYRKAIEQYSKVLEQEPTNLVALVQSADSYLSINEVKKAEGFYEKVIQNYPNIAIIRTKLEVVRNIQKGPKEILNTAHKYYQQAPRDPQAVNGYIRALILNNHLDEAVGVMKKSIKVSPKEAQYMIMLGDLYLLQRNISAAKNAFEQGMKLASRDINILLNIANRYENNSLDKEAEAIYSNLVKMYPDSIMVVNQTAWFYTDRKGDFERAKPFIEILRVKGEGAYEKDTIGWFFYKTGEYNSAEAYFRDALQMDPDNIAIRGRLSLVLLKVGKIKEGLAEAEKVIPILPPGKLKEELSSRMALAKKGDKKQ